MARNLNYAVGGSKCYDGASANCEKYGRLYDWNTAKTVCPAGWHLPSYAEWNKLLGFVGSKEKLKASSGWSNGGDGTDEYGFSALPGGAGAVSGSVSVFLSVGYDCVWWTATELEFIATHAYLMDVSCGGANCSNYSNKSYLLYVRCVQN